MIVYRVLYDQTVTSEFVRVIRDAPAFRRRGESALAGGGGGHHHRKTVRQRRHTPVKAPGEGGDAVVVAVQGRGGGHEALHHDQPQRIRRATRHSLGGESGEPGAGSGEGGKDFFFSFFFFFFFSLYTCIRYDSYPHLKPSSIHFFNCFETRRLSSSWVNRVQPANHLIHRALVCSTLRLFNRG